MSSWMTDGTVGSLWDIRGVQALFSYHERSKRATRLVAAAMRRLRGTGATAGLRSLATSRLARFGNALAVVDNVGRGAVAGAAFGVGDKAVVASEAARVGVGRALVGRCGYAMRRIMAFLLVAMGVDLVQEVLLDFVATELLDSSPDGRVLVDEDVEGR